MNYKIVLILIVAISCVSFASADYSSSIVLNLSFDDADYSNPTLNDLSASNNDFTNNVSAQASPSQTGLFGESFFFDGVADNMYRANDGDFAVSTGAFTIMTLVKNVNEPSNLEYIWAKRSLSPPYAGTMFGVAGSSSSACGFTNNYFIQAGTLTTGYIWLCGGTPSTTSFDSVTYKRNTSSISLWVNGVIVDESSASGWNSDYGGGSTYERIGTDRDNSGSRFHGYIDDFKFWKGYALTESEIQSTYASSFYIYATDVYDDSTVSNFNITMVSDTDTYTFQTTTGSVETNLTHADTTLWNITFDADTHFSKTYNNVPTVPDFTGELIGAYVTITAKNTLDNSSVNTFSVTSQNDSVLYTTTNGTIIAIATPGQLFYNASSPTYLNKPEFNITFTQKTNESYELEFEPVYTFEFWDEKTLEPFNMSSFDSMQFQVICPSETQIYQLNSTSQNYTTTFSCEYTKLRFLLEYGTDVYYRTLILPKTGVNKNVYLLNLDDTTSVFNTFISYDLINTCPDPTIIFYKTIQSTTEQITGDYADAEDKVSAYLLLGGEYNIGLTCSGETERNIGSYIADTAGQKIIRIFDIGIGTTSTDFDGKMFYSLYKINESGTIKLRTYYNDTSGTTTQTTFTVSQFGSASPLYTASSTSQDITYSYSVPAYLEDAYLVIEFNITNPTYGNRGYFKNIQPVTILTLPTYFNSPQTLKFILLGIIVVLALTFTISTSNIGTLLLGGAASFLAVVGWYPMAAGIITLMLLVGVVQIFREGESKT